MGNRIIDQSRTPLVEAMRDYQKDIKFSFDVPIHRRGHGNWALREFMGDECTMFGFNSSNSLDNILSPHGAIRQAEQLMADAFGANEALFMVNGTSSAVQTMIIASCSPGDKIILPRNVHISVINAIIIAGAIPIFISPGYDKNLGLSLGVFIEDLVCVINENLDAKAILINNPTYYGICSDLKKIVDIGHKHNMLVLVDEAHGTHNYFYEKSPLTAMQAGADFSAISMHKTGGALTQSAALLVGNSLEYSDILSKANLLRTSSASYILMSSLDIARKNLVEKGLTRNQKMICMANYAREELNKIEGLYSWGKELCDGKYVYDVDETKLCINVKGTGLSGNEVYEKFVNENHIQLEVADSDNVMALIGDSDTKNDIDNLIEAFKGIQKYKLRKTCSMNKVYSIMPTICMIPRDAFFALKESVKLKESLNRISGENIMCYPPGIPIITMGELITKDIIEYIEEAKKNGCLMVGAKDAILNKIQVVKA